MEKCCICQKTFSSLFGVAVHVKQVHRVEVEDYYNKYIKTDPQEGVCLECGGKCHFTSLHSGYLQKYCSVKCCHAEENRAAKERARIKASKVPKEQWETCAICGKKCIGFRGLATHITFIHKIKSKDYYDKYLKTDSNEGICPECGASTRYANLNVGYVTYCERKCMRNSAKVREKLHNGKNYRKIMKRVAAQLDLCGEDYNLRGLTTVGVDEPPFLKALQKVCPYIIHPQYVIAGRFLDGYIKEILLDIEFDEYYHNSNAQQIEDQKRAQDIREKNSGITFFRVTQHDWNTDLDKVIKDFTKTFSQN